MNVHYQISLSLIHQRFGGKLIHRWNCLQAKGVPLFYRLRTSCAPAVGRGDFKKLETEEGAVQPITAAIWFRFASPKFLLHCVAQKLRIAAERYVLL